MAYLKRAGRLDNCCEQCRDTPCDVCCPTLTYYDTPLESPVAWTTITLTATGQYTWDGGSYLETLDIDFTHTWTRGPISGGSNEEVFVIGSKSDCCPYAFHVDVSATVSDAITGTTDVVGVSNVTRPIDVTVEITSYFSGSPNSGLPAVDSLEAECAGGVVKLPHYEWSEELMDWILIEGVYDYTDNRSSGLLVSATFTGNATMNGSYGVHSCFPIPSGDLGAAEFAGFSLSGPIGTPSGVYGTHLGCEGDPSTNTGGGYTATISGTWTLTVS